MSEFSFRLLLEVPRDLTDDDLNALYEATDSDATFGSDDDGWSAEFDREANDLATAVFDAIVVARRTFRPGYARRSLRRCRGS